MRWIICSTAILTTVVAGTGVADGADASSELLGVLHDTVMDDAEPTEVRSAALRGYYRLHWLDSRGEDERHLIATMPLLQDVQSPNAIRQIVLDEMYWSGWCNDVGKRVAEDIVADGSMETELRISAASVLSKVYEDPASNSLLRSKCLDRAATPEARVAAGTVLLELNPADQAIETLLKRHDEEPDMLALAVVNSDGVQGRAPLLLALLVNSRLDPYIRRLAAEQVVVEDDSWRKSPEAPGLLRDPRSGLVRALVQKLPVTDWKSPLLQELLLDGQCAADVRYWAAEGLALEQSAVARDAFRKLLAEASVESAQFALPVAMRALAKWSPDVDTVAELRAVVANDDATEQARTHAAVTLYRDCGQEDMRDYLLDVIHDANAPVSARLRAAEGIGRFETESLIALGGNRLARNEMVRAECIGMAHVDASDDRGIEFLIAVVRDELNGTRLRRAAIRALAASGSQRASVREVLMSALSDAMVDRDAASAISELFSESEPVGRELLNIIEDGVVADEDGDADDVATIAALQALSRWKVNRDQILTTLVRSLRSSDTEYVAATKIEAIGRLARTGERAQRDGCDALVAVLQDHSYSDTVRAVAIYTLVSIAESEEAVR